MKYAYIYFDVDGTLLYKNGLYDAIHSCLKTAGFSVPLEVLRNRHGIVSGLVPFPSQTTQEFYNFFNGEFLHSLGIFPQQKLLDDLYIRCKNLQWRAYDDVDALDTISIRKGILSNWDKTLEKKLSDLVPCTFDQVFSSGRIGIRKPDKGFYQKAFAQTGIRSEQIVYIGDSVRLDMEPALALGARAILIDREEQYPWYAGERIESLREITPMIQQ